ncbi:MAG: DUF881 domain-containing protein [Clostridia bacterium]|nr:DUF881 domain-containing protein [Clostridia bacterium]
MKGKKSLMIIIGFTAFIFTLVMFTQFKTVEQTDITAIETMRETELRTELAKIKSKYDEVVLKLDETEKKIVEYETQMANEQDSAKILEDELKEAQTYLGYTAVVGEGITVTLADSLYKDIDSYDLITLVNELKLAGAEAISINDNRVVTTTDIVDIAYKYIMVNGRRISGPYVIKAIGNKKYLESGITLKNGYKDEMEANGINIDYETSNEININAYDGNIEMQYSTVVE